MFTLNNSRKYFLVLFVSLAFIITPESKAALFNFSGQMDVYYSGQLVTSESAISAVAVPYMGATPGSIDLNTENPSGFLAPADGEWSNEHTFFEIVDYFDQPGNYSWDSGSTIYDFTLLPGQIAMGTEYTWYLNRGSALFGWDVSSGNITGLDLDGDGVLGAAVNSPSPGLSFDFNGTLTAVPIPPAILLFISGFIALVGFAKRKKA